jgi:transposase
MIPLTDAKSKILRQQGVFHAHADAVTDARFRTGDFFDPRDLVQVKYEMLRRVQVEQHAVTAASAAFGFSRPAFYQAQAAYRRHGLPGLIPRRPGPQRAHKLTDTVLDFLLEQQVRDSPVPAAALAQRVQQQFGLTVHPRSIQRAFQRQRKKGLPGSSLRAESAPSGQTNRGRAVTRTCGARS